MRSAARSRARRAAAPCGDGAACGRRRGARGGGDADGGWHHGAHRKSGPRAAAHAHVWASGHGESSGKAAHGLHLPAGTRAGPCQPGKHLCPTPQAVGTKSSLPRSGLTLRFRCWQITAALHFFTANPEPKILSILITNRQPRKIAELSAEPQRIYRGAQRADERPSSGCTATAKAGDEAVTAADAALALPRRYQG